MTRVETIMSSLTFLVFVPSHRQFGTLGSALSRKDDATSRCPIPRNRGYSEQGEEGRMELVSWPAAGPEMTIRSVLPKTWASWPLLLRAAVAECPARRMIGTLEGYEECIGRTH
jgi:hypothetical protein